MLTYCWLLFLDKGTDNYIPLLTMTQLLHWICQVTKQLGLALTSHF
jgi:hypothetical protein